jgi:hypothetical protein
MIDYNRFVDRSRPGRNITQGGLTSHAQAGARMEGEHVIFLLLQGQEAHVRAHVARFHEGNLPHYNRFPGKGVYLESNPIAPLPSGAGMEMAIVHRALVPGRLPANATHLFTFGPPHFGLMFQAAMPLPMLPHWEPVLWDLGQEAGLIHEFADTWNVRVWLVRADTEQWQQLMSSSHPLFPFKPGGSTRGDSNE